MRFFIAIIIILLLPFIIRFIGRLIKGYAMGKMEDNMRRMMGMPTRAEEKKARKEAERRNGWAAPNDGERPTESQRHGFRGRSRNHNVGNPADDLRMMRLYAEDVEFVEIREYSADIRFEQDASGKARITMEEQMSDAEFVVIK